MDRQDPPFQLLRSIIPEKTTVSGSASLDRSEETRGKREINLGTRIIGSGPLAAISLRPIGREKLNAEDSDWGIGDKPGLAAGWKASAGRLANRLILSRSRSLLHT